MVNVWSLFIYLRLEFISDLKISNILKHESRILSQEKNEKYFFLSQKLQSLESDQKRSNENQDLVKSIKSELKNFFEDKRLSLEVQNKRNKNIFIKQPSLKLLNDIKATKKLNEITKLNIGETIIEDKEIILDHLTEYYKALYDEDIQTTLRNNAQNTLTKIENKTNE